MLKSIVISSISFSTSFINILPIFTINISSTLFFIDFEIEDSGQNFGLKKKNQTLKPYTSHLYPKNRGGIFFKSEMGIDGTGGTDAMVSHLSIHLFPRSHAQEIWRIIASCTH